MDTSERFWSRVDKSGECWLWTGNVSTGGYGQVRVDGKPKLVHRYAYELVVGPIPAGLVIDHLCRNRGCVNPSHMEAVTHRVNILRGVGYTAQAAAKTHCKRGHEFTPENTITATNGRECRTCRQSADRLKKREQYKRKRRPKAPVPS